MILVTFIVFALTMPPVVEPAPAPRPRAHGETCPGATYFIKHGEQASWTPHKRLLCRIGGHDFYGEPLRPKGLKK